MSLNVLIIICIVVIQSIILPKLKWPFFIYILPTISLTWGIYQFVLKMNFISLIGYLSLSLLFLFMGISSREDNRKDREERIAKDNFKSK